jgi:cytochrome c oxidase cbb3-type subunit 3
MLARPWSKSVLLLAALWAASCFAAWPQTPRQPSSKNIKPAAMPGKQRFASTCAHCHGLDGRGGERAPNIAENPRVQHLSDEQISRIIQHGIPGTSMPAFHSLQTADVQALVAYLRTLQGTRQTLKLTGDPVRGETLFFNKAGCSSCHMIAGKGGFIASDLTVYARTHTAEQIRSAITDPAPVTDPQARLVTATTRGGAKVVGRIRNEDNFSLQLQTLEGTFHFVTKSDLEGLEYNPQPLMPSNYSSTLDSGELNDVVSYLIKVSGTTAKATSRKADDWED